jgi:hypothetical protein
VLRELLFPYPIHLHAELLPPSCHLLLPPAAAACRYGSDEMVDRWMHWVTDDWDSLAPGNYEEHAANSSNGSSTTSSSSKDATAPVAASAAAKGTGSS